MGSVILLPSISKATMWIVSKWIASKWIASMWKASVWDDRDDIVRYFYERKCSE